MRFFCMLTLVQLPDCLMFHELFDILNGEMSKRKSRRCCFSLLALMAFIRYKLNCEHVKTWDCMCVCNWVTQGSPEKQNQWDVCVCVSVCIRERKQDVYARACVCVCVCVCVLERESFLIAQLLKNPPAMQETPVHFLGQEDALEKE